MYANLIISSKLYIIQLVIQKYTTKSNIFFLNKRNKIYIINLQKLLKFLINYNHSAISLFNNNFKKKTKSITNEIGHRVDYFG